MPVNYRSFPLSKGVNVSVVTDEKFKSCVASIKLLFKAPKDNLASYALLPSLLSYTNKNYPTAMKMNKRLNYLYGASLFSSCGLRGDMYEISISCEYIMDKFALGESVAENVIKILIDCVTDPNFDDVSFESGEFAIRKNDLLDTIDSEINDKISFALSEACEIIYCGENASKRYYGSRDEVNALTLVDIKNAYRYVINNAMIEIYLVGGSDFKTELSLLENAFNKRDTYNIDFHSYSKLKNNTEYVSSLMDVSQSNLVIAYKTDYYNHFANALMADIFGGGYSLLFENVREKLSLCYFCDASYFEVKGTLSVVSAVDPKNVLPTVKEIEHQLDRIRNGEVTDEMILDKKRQIRSGLRSSYDKVGSLMSWYHLNRLRGQNLSIEDYLNKIDSVTCDDIIKAAKSFKLDTVFVLGSEEVRFGE